MAEKPQPQRESPFQGEDGAACGAMLRCTTHTIGAQSQCAAQMSGTGFAPLASTYSLPLK